MPEKEVRIINRQTGEVRFVTKATAENTHILSQCGFEVEELDEQPEAVVKESFTTEIPQPAQSEAAQDAYSALAAASTEQTEAIIKKERKPRQPKQ